MLENLPPIMAVLNGISMVLLVLGWRHVRAGRVESHKKVMIAAFVFSTAFLVCYLTHRAMHEHVPFTHEGWPKTVYYFILITHVPLAALMVPPILVLLVAGLKGRIDRHRKVARITLPVWLYVNVTGVLVYLMLYKLFPPA